MIKILPVITALSISFCLIVFLTSCVNDSSTNPEPSSFSVSGRIVDPSGNGVAGVSVSVSVKSAVTDSSGFFNIQALGDGNYTISFLKGGLTFEPASLQISISGSDVTTEVVTASEPIPLTFVTIPGGTFQMGDIQNYNQSSDEKPVHDVSLSSFQMSIYEVTQGQYQSVMGSNPSKNRGVGNNFPVYNINWYDAVRFCNALSEQEGYEPCYNESTWACDFDKNGFRLPTEAEWEYACRAGTETMFYTGNNLNSDTTTSTDLDKAGWYKGNSDPMTHSVGLKVPNAWGLYDMHGNVTEWCNDWYYESSYSSSPSSNPTGPSSGPYRVGRGGGWQELAHQCRSASRYRLAPTGGDFNGFRVVRRP